MKVLSILKNDYEWWILLWLLVSPMHLVLVGFRMSNINMVTIPLVLQGNHHSIVKDLSSMIYILIGKPLYYINRQVCLTVCPKLILGNGTSYDHEIIIFWTFSETLIPKKCNFITFLTQNRKNKTLMQSYNTYSTQYKNLAESGVTVHAWGVGVNCMAIFWSDRPNKIHFV